MSRIASDYFYGWDLLFTTIGGQINKKDDLLIALVHFVLTKHSQFRCLGLGDDKTAIQDSEVTGTELLPDRWNDDDTKYALRYVNNKKVFNLLGLRTEGSLIITLMEVKTRNISNIALDPQEWVKDVKGNINKMIPNVAHLVDRFRNELLEPVFSGNSRSATTQTTVAPSAPASSIDDPLRIGEPRRPMGGFGNPLNPGPAPFGFPQVGTGDLDPLGRGQGNLFPFPSHPEFRIGPNNGPRPRFDPYGPEHGGRQNPNPDHLPPPGFGYNDDYYM